MNTPILLVPLLSGCVMVYAPGVPAPGRVLPPRDGETDIALELDLERNVADGVSVDPDGTASASSGAPVWPGASLAVRHGFSDRVGLDARLTSSLLLPVPFPVPSGFGVAPVFRLAEPGADLGLHASPRLVWVTGGSVVAAGDQWTGESSAVGAEAPITLSWRPGRVFSAGATPFLRGFRVTSRTDVTPAGGATQEGVPVSFWAWGFGATLDLFLDLGPVRLAVGAGLEGGPDPGASLPVEGEDRGPVLWYPQGGLSLGAAWGGRDAQ